MGERSRIIYEIALELGKPSLSTTAEIKSFLPQEFSNLRSINSLKRALLWLKEGGEVPQLPVPQIRKLTEKDKTEIRRLYQASLDLGLKPNYSAIGRKFNVSGTWVKKLCSNQH